MEITVTVYDDEGEFQEVEMHILECPFCHLSHEQGENEFFRIFYNENDTFSVECFACGASGPLGDTEEDAVQRWNERSSTSREETNK